MLILAKLECAYHPVEQAVHLYPVVAGGGPGELVVLVVGENHWGRGAAMQLYEYSAKVQHKQHPWQEHPSPVHSQDILSHAGVVTIVIRGGAR